MELARKIHEMVAPYRNLKLDANGMTKVISHLLSREEISHAACIGTISINEDEDHIPHAWIRLNSGEIVDFRASTWFPDGPVVPEGVFRPETTPLSYDGVEVFLSVSQVLFDVLTQEKRVHRS